MLIVKLFFVYIGIVFLASTIVYNVNVVEYFFRLKGLWASLLIFPYLILIKRDGILYLIKLIFPVAVVSNIIYIISALTGVALLPEMGVAKTTLPGGLEVYRVFGGTFFGEIFFLGFIYLWITDKFKLYQLPLVILFMLPQILAFGRQAWLYYAFAIIFFFFWNTLRKKEFKLIFRQAVIFAIIGIALIITFMKFIPDSDYMFDAILARVEQGQSDVEYKSGTYGTRVENIQALLGLWTSTNVLVGIGMHPFWVIKAETVEENIFAWGFSDVRWIGVLVAYGIIGFIIAIIFQLQFIFVNFKILKRSDPKNLLTFFSLLLLIQLLFDTLINFSFNLFSLSIWGLSFYLSFYIAITIFLYEKHIGTTDELFELKQKASKLKRSSYMKKFQRQ